MGIEAPWAKTDEEVLRFFNVKSDVGLTKEQVRPLVLRKEK